MKALIKYLRPVARILTLLFLFQGCTAYKKASVTIEEAATEGYSVKVTTIENYTIKYNHIELKDGQYVGVKKVDRQQIFVPLKKGEINTIRPKDKVLSTIGNIAIAWPIVGLVVFAINGGGNNIY